MDARGEDAKAGGEILIEGVDYGRAGLEYLGVALKSHCISKANRDVHVFGVVNVFVVCNHDD